MRTLFLQAPSYDGFDGGAGSRYQARREIRSFWYPTWLAQAAALVPDSKLIDAPPHGLRAADILQQAHDFDLAVLHTSAPSFSGDAAMAAAMKEANPGLRIGMVGATVAVEPQKSLAAAASGRFCRRRGIRLHDQGGRGRPRAGRDQRPVVPRQPRRDCS